MRTLSCLLGLALAALPFAVGCSSSSSDEDATESSADSEDALTAGANSGYFIVTHRDLRRCASPMCGGIFVKRVNQDKTRCVDGSLQAECYVESIQLTGVGLSANEEDALRGSVESGKALIKARLYKKRINGATYGTLKANEGWLGATGATPDGTFYRAADNGIRCITAPCPTTTATPLNNIGNPYNVIDVLLSNTSADQASLDRAEAALATSEGVLVAGGVALPKCMARSTNCGPKLMPTEFYLRVVAAPPAPAAPMCGGFAGIACPGSGKCVDDPTDTCDPNNGGADCSGRCECGPRGIMCMQGKHWDGSPSVCACVSN